ncbi:hypothetical protein FKW77_001927 [Venturia effusa]|uniref:Uncharacterized protein n=1 Tax=Venturia effusa TaxID=50376 RepID=A0A517LQQ2_9PEZI|nr:hypothetical protein FKW77_001927 [Venturia effusa]
MESVRQILSYNIPDAYEGRAEGTTVSLSLKAWTAPYPQILGQNNLTVHPPTNAGLLAMFGVEDDLDQLRLSTYAYPLNSYVDVLSTEGDSVASFHRQITTAVRLAFTNYPFIIERSESGPPGHAPFAETVDHYFSFTHVNRECLLAAGELKNRGIIRRARWYGVQAAAGTEARLGKELRGYATKYRTPQMYCYDGSNLLIVQFRAQTEADIQDEACPIDCMVIPRSSEVDDHCSMRMALYRLVSQGIRRCLALYAPQLAIGACRREWEYFSGCPYWRSNVGRTADLVVGGVSYQREFDQQNRAWKWTPNNGQVGQWDTYVL